MTGFLTGFMTTFGTVIGGFSAILAIGVIIFCGAFVWVIFDEIRKKFKKRKR